MALTAAPNISRLINAAHRYANEHGLEISPSRVSTLVRRHLHANPTVTHRELQDRLVACLHPLHPRRPRHMVLVDPTGNEAARNVDAATRTGSTR